MKHILKIASTLFFIFFISACAGGGGNSKHTTEMNALVGMADKKLMVEKYGPPDKQATIDDGTDYWEYRLNEQKFTSTTGYRFSTYDRLRLTFKKGTLQSWKRDSIVE